MNVIWEIFQHLRTSEAKSEASGANIRSRSNSTDIEHLNEKVESLSLLTQAMWELLERNGFSRSDLEQKIEEIDLRDGVRDGKVTGATHCPECGHRLRKNRVNCYWCGAKIKGAPFAATS